jgi:hypothetical protein
MAGDFRLQKRLRVEPSGMRPQLFAALKAAEIGCGNRDMGQDRQGGQGENGLSKR